MLIGYARVSTHDQNLDLQLDALLLKAGCEAKRIYKDTISGAKIERKGLDEALSHLRAGDTLVVWRLDRLGQTLKQLIELINDLQSREVGFRSLQENIDTTMPGGKLVFHIFGALAEFEREVIRDRTNAGLQAACAHGRLGGRPKALDDKKAALAGSLYASGEHSIKDICDTLHISRATLYKYVGKSQRGQDQ
ncbi:recombinase family protein [Ktedonospora formicarum]|uniref:DNA invertase n=1 Tax=Ktedonospora formicarum TaxID=2778364 RepID=A0A8J3IAT9_9CHLR|nr:recombinase family protein [Ktedonospora formicarum]GHO49222.1 DNA invertase [Ktedonospora formicarum]